MFISTILLPIVGNAAEHAAAIVFAAKGKMALAVGIAVGSAAQIVLFVLPLCVLLAWGLGQPLSLDMGVFETATLFLGVLAVVVIASNGQSDWLKGLALVFMYAFVSVAYYFR